MLKASPSGADKIQSFPDLRQMLLYAALGGIVLAALFAPWLTDVSPLDQDLMNLDQPFSPAHPLGTDSLGRDILARLVYGARTTLEISLGGTFIAFFIGAGIGLTALSMGRFAAGVFFAFIDLVRHRGAGQRSVAAHGGHRHCLFAPCRLRRAFCLSARSIAGVCACRQKFRRQPHAHPEAAPAPKHHGRTDHPAGHRFAALHRYGVGAEFPWTGKLAG